MNDYLFKFYGTACRALPSGGLFLPDHNTLCVSDLHLGKSDRIARRSGVMLPPYEGHETLKKLEADINATKPQTVICLGDSFDDLDAVLALPDDLRILLARLRAGRNWIWIEGNHDPGPITLGGTHSQQVAIGTLTFRHIASIAQAEVSGHYHPKHRLSGRTRPAFIYDGKRLILPAYGTYTGGLSSDASALRRLFDDKAIAIMTGQKSIPVPLTKTPPLARSRGKFC